MGQRYLSRPTSWLVASLLAGSVGYLAGREHLIGHIRSSFVRPTEDSLSTPGSSQDESATESYVQIKALLDREMHEQIRRANVYERIIAARNPIERARITAAARETLLEQLEPRPGQNVGPNPTIESRYRQDGVEVHRIRLRTFPGVVVNVALLVPIGTSGARPTLLALHGTGGDLQSLLVDDDYHHGFAIELARRGYVVAAPLLVSSTPEVQFLSRRALASGWSVHALDLWQLVGVVDYLETLEIVDRTHIGAYGISRGGQRALMLGAVDDRVSLVICSGYFTDRYEWLFENPAWPRRSWSVLNFVPNMAFFLDDLNQVALIQPRFLAIASGMRTPRHAGAVSEYSKVERLYRHIGYPERTTFVSFDGAHEAYVPGVAPFLDRWRESQIETPPARLPAP